MNPRQQAPDPRRERRLTGATSAPRTSSSCSLRNKTVLAIDDDRLILKLLRRFFSALDVRIVTASTGREGLDAHKQHGGIDIILLDISLGGMCGLAVADAVRAYDKSTPIVIMSGCAPPDTLAEDVQGFLQKPFSVLELKDMLRCVLDP